MKLGDYTMRRTPHIVAAALANVDLSLKTANRTHIERVIEACHGSLPAAAKLLQVSRRSLERMGYRSSIK
jgi:ActR/RegA family two-component response regulator